MGRNTAEYRQEHKTEFQDWNTEAQHEKALASFKEILETFNPELRASFDEAGKKPENFRDPNGTLRPDLTGPVTYEALHPAWKDLDMPSPPWMDARTDIQALSHIEHAFQEATRDLHYEDKSLVAYQVTANLTAPTTHHVTETLNRYLHLENRAEDEHLVTDVTDAANQVMDKLDNFRNTMTGALQLGNLRPEAYREILNQMDWISAGAEKQMAESLSETLDHKLRQVSPEDRDNYQKAIADTLTAPVQERVDHQPSTGDSPVLQHANRLDDHYDQVSHRDAVAARTLHYIQERLNEYRAEETNHIGLQAEHAARSLAERMDIDGGPNPEAIHHTLTAINGFHASLDFEDSHLAESQRIMQALHHAAMDDSYPGREAIAGYVADALSWNARNTIESFIDGNHPDKYEDRDIPFPLSYADMNKAAAHSLIEEVEHLTQRLRNTMEYNGNPEALMESARALSAIPEALESLDSTGELPSYLEHRSTLEFKQAVEERTNFMIQMMLEDIGVNHPATGSPDMNWTERLQHPLIVASMSQYADNLPPADQRRLGQEIVRRAEREQQ